MVLASKNSIMKTCKSCGTNFEISENDQQYFLVHGISHPEYCRICSWGRKLSWQNEYQIYKRKCDATGKTMISVYKEGTEFPVYEKEYWTSGEWNLPEATYDENKPFFEQYWEFSKRVPRPSTNRVGAENSEYAHLIFDSKSCYLSFQVFQSENLIGCYRAVRMKDSANSFFCIESELLCECVNCSKCYNLKFSEDSENCHDSAFLYDCKGCKNCFMCWNLRSKEFCFQNEMLSKEEYEKKMAEYDLGLLAGQKKAKQEFHNLREKFTVKALHMINCENCYGDYLVGCKDCNEIYFSDGCRDSKSILRGTEDINSYDSVVGGKIEICYNTLQPGWCYKCAFLNSCNRCSETYLSESCDDCKECLGCVSLKRGNFCIFNKRYTEEEYRRLKDKIFAELATNGNQFEEFFDPAKSPFNYEETIADLYFPRTEMKTSDGNFGEGKCALCGRISVFSEAEKKFYAKIGLALPDRCFSCRIMSLARPYSVVELKTTNCASCNDEIHAGKSERVYEKVYCEKCYLKETY
jgi:hypothetical protein